MAMVTFNLLGEITNQDLGYTVVIEEIGHQFARLNVSTSNLKSTKKTQENTQGIDLTAEECEALGQHLIAVSKRLSQVG